MSDPQTEGVLKREIGPLGVGATTINIVMGSGLFVIPATLGIVGGWAPAIIVVCALVMAAVTLCFAEASSRVPTAGGAYGFVGEALGPTAATIVGGQIWVSGTFAGAGILSAAAAQLAPFSPTVGTGTGRVLLLLSACTIFALIAMRGAKESARAVELTMILKLAPLILLIVVLAASPAAPSRPLPPLDLVTAAPLLILGIYLFAGMESAIGINGEVRDPARSVPIGLFGAIAVFLIFAILIQLVAERSLGAALSQSGAPLVEAANRANGWLGPVIAGAAVISMLGCVAGLTINIPRVVYAFARDGMLPRPLAYVSPTRQTPTTAIIVNALIVAVLAIGGEFGPLAAIASLASMSVYVLGCISVVALRRREVALAGPVTAWAFTPYAAAIGVVANLGIIATAKWSELAGLIGSIIFFALLALMVRTRPMAAAQ
jgi:APA family basic amino acid/polyamine antiporter